MSTDTMCRVCLVNNLNLYSVRNDLQNTYESITREKYDNAGYPLSMCYICLSVLKKCYKFVKTAQDTNMFLKQWFNQQNEIKVLNARPLYSLSITNETTKEIYIDNGNNPTMEISLEIKQERLEDDNQQETYIELERIDNEDDNSDNDSNSFTHSDTEVKPIPTEVWIEETPHTVCTPDINNVFHITSQMDPCSSKSEDPESKPYCCDMCSYRCKKKYQLTYHRRLHTGEKTFSCDVCDFKCALEYAFMRHVKTHTGEKPFSCNICSYRCIERSALKRHIQQIHADVKPFACHLCDYKCALKYVLINHMRKHTGEKPFACNVCEYKCTERSNLKRHVQQMHTPIKAFTCDICGYQCALKFAMINHRRTHTGEKPFSCDKCDYKCTRKYTLNRHLSRDHGSTITNNRNNTNIFESVIINNPNTVESVIIHNPNTIESVIIHNPNTNIIVPDINNTDLTNSQ